MVDDLTMKRVHGAGIAGGRVTMVRPAKLPPRREVVRLIADHIDLMYENARVVAREVAVPSGRPVDILVSIDDQIICAVDVFDGVDPSWIVHTLHHVAWMRENLATIARINGSGADAGEARVKVAAIVARMTAPASHALRLLEDIPLDRFTVKCFMTSEERFLALERWRSSMPDGYCVDGTAMQSIGPKPELKPLELTEAEIADFLGDDVQMRSASGSDIDGADISG